MIIPNKIACKKTEYVIIEFAIENKKSKNSHRFTDF